MTKIKQILLKVPGIRWLKKLKKLPASNSSSVNGTGNIVINKGSFERVKLDITGCNNSIEIGANTRISDTLIYIRGNDHKVVIADNCYMSGGEIWIEDSNCSLTIAAKTTIESAHLAITESSSQLIIGEDCMLAKQVEIRTGDSHSIIDIASGKRINKAANVVIGAHVWIGAHVKILKGVSIGNNAIVGTGSVVTRDISPGSIAAGVPAIVIKSGVTWDRRRLPN